MTRKWLAIGIILLFVGTCIIPSVTSKQTYSKNIISVDDFVEITTVVKGKEGIMPFAVKLTKEEANKVDCLFETIRERLKESTSEEETELILKDAVIELDRYGLLGELTIEDAQSLVLGEHPNSRVIQYDKSKTVDENYDFKVVGKTTYTGFCGHVDFGELFTLFYTLYFLFSRALLFGILGAPFAPILGAIIAYMDEHGLITDELVGLFDNYINLRISLFNNLFPFEFIKAITLGYYNYHNPEDQTPSSGWVSTDGSNGVVEWEGDILYGNTGRDWYSPNEHGEPRDLYCEVAQNFSGINYYIGDWLDSFIFAGTGIMLTGNAYYMGNADYVKIGYENEFP